jgi:hypothetical protein
VWRDSLLVLSIRNSLVLLLLLRLVVLVSRYNGSRSSSSGHTRTSSRWLCLLDL